MNKMTANCNAMEPSTLEGSPQLKLSEVIKYQSTSFLITPKQCLQKYPNPDKPAIITNVVYDQHTFTSNFLANPAHKIYLKKVELCSETKNLSRIQTSKQKEIGKYSRKKKTG